MRDLIKKYPNSILWDKDKNKWTEFDLKDLNLMKKGIDPIQHNKKKYGLNAVKIQRVCDGKIYDSITDCRSDNNYCKATIYKIINEGIYFKRI